MGELGTQLASKSDTYRYKGKTSPVNLQQATVQPSIWRSHLRMYCALRNLMPGLHTECGNPKLQLCLFSKQLLVCCYPTCRLACLVSTEPERLSGCLASLNLRSQIKQMYKQFDQLDNILKKLADALCVHLPSLPS